MKQLNQIVVPLLSWYNHFSRDLPWRKNTDPYCVWISEIMLQQTRVEAVIPYYERFMKEFPTVVTLAEAEEDHLLKLWEGLGYYSRARNLQKTAKIILSDYSGSFPANFLQLRSLPGIGEYTAGAIASIAFGLPVPAVDGNVLRVISRILCKTDDILSAKTKKEITQQIAQIIPTGRAGDFTQALMELGAIICLPNGAPLCQQCPVQFCCQAFKRQLTDKIPVKRKKAKRKAENKTVFVFFYQDRFAIRKRKEKGILSGLWELPNTDGHLDESQVRLQLSQWNLEASELHREKNVKHIFTHIEWNLCYYFISVCQKSDLFEWITLEDWNRQYPLPNAFRHYEEKIKTHLSEKTEKM